MKTKLGRVGGENGYAINLAIKISKKKKEAHIVSTLNQS